MQDQPNDLDGRVKGLDDSVERLSSEVTSLKLELATLVSAIRELQQQGARSIVPARHLLPPIEPAIKPSMVPGAMVVVAAVGLLSWQLVASPHVDSPVPPAAAVSPRPSAFAPVPDHNATVAEPPLAPLVRPTIYRGTLTVRADHPGALVFVNRKPVGTAPVQVRNLRAGAHLVWVESEGYRRWTRVVTVPAEHVTRVAADLEPIDAER